MNIYIVCEGDIGERHVYESWVPMVNPALTFVDNLFSITANNFSIIVGGGFPNYFEVIEHAIDDVNNYGNIDRVVIAVDSENQSFQEKHDEIAAFLQQKHCNCDTKIVIQHFCLEAWALGNKRVGPRNPKLAKLIDYKKCFNVLDRDPELLPPYPPEFLNRAQFAEKYLRAMLLDKHRNLTYSKRNPKALLHKSYFAELNLRLNTTGHIASFAAFLSAFK